MSNRRSERLRRKREATPGLSQPGAYSLHHDGYTVESEASFLPPSTNSTPAPLRPSTASFDDSPPPNTRPSPTSPSPATNNTHNVITTATTSTPTTLANTTATTTRRTRYRNSPHRFSVEDTPPTTTMPTNAKPPPPNPQGPPLVTPPPRRPRADATERVVNRVRASLHDILSSATRRPVNPRWRPPPSLGATGAAASRRRPSDTPPSYIPSSSVVRSLRNMPFSPSHDDGDDGDDLVPSDDERDDDNSARPSSTRLPPSPAEIVAVLARRARRLSPVSLLLPCFLLMLVVLLSLDLAVSSRTPSRTPAYIRLQSFTRSNIPPSIQARLSSALNTTTTTTTTLTSFPLEILRNFTTSFFFRPTWPTLRPRHRHSQQDAPNEQADVVTRAELEAEILPRVIAAAKTAAHQEAGVAAREAREARAAAELSAAEAAKSAAGVATAVPVPSSDDGFAAFVERYAADKDLPADFALASAGGAVIATQPTVLSVWTRFARQYALAVLAERQFTPMPPRMPSVILSPDVLPGNCWAFEGDGGSVTIRLARPVVVNAVTVEHTPRRSVFSIESAMRRFRVAGLPVREEMEEVALGNFMFDLHGEGKRHLQTFDVDGGNDVVMRAVRVEVLSNHGANHTAIYRIRVHGEEDMSPFLTDVDTANYDDNLDVEDL